MYVKRDGGTSYAVSYTNETTFKDLVQALVDNDTSTTQEWVDDLDNTALFQGSKLVKGVSLEPGATYIVRRRAKRIADAAAAAAPRASKEEVDAFLDSLDPVKIVVNSTATTGDVAKNIKQQFKFHKQPVSPIVLIDITFNSGYNFFDYLAFEKEDISPFIRCYRKPEGNPLTINTTDNARTPAEKTAYLSPVNAAARKERVDLMQELKICCVNYFIKSEDEFKSRGAFTFEE